MDTKLIKDLLTWARLVGNWRFALALEGYAELLGETSIEELILSREEIED